MGVDSARQYPFPRPPTSTAVRWSPQGMAPNLAPSLQAFKESQAESLG
jgi:hypothetical protein